MNNKILVRSEGSPQSNIAMVCEAPGEDEVREGRPLVGGAGQQVDQRIAAAGGQRHWFYLTNVLKERPDNNDISQFISFTKKGVVTTPEYDKYEQALYIELSMTDANVIVAMGAVALWALTRKRGILKWRGSILETPFVRNRNGVGGRKVIPTIHTAAVLHGGPFIWNHWITRDIKLALAESSTPDIVLPKRNIRIRPAFIEIMAYLQSIATNTLVAFDIEVMREEMSCISFAKSPTDCMVVPFIASGKLYLTPDEELEVMREIARILEDDSIKKVGHYLTFDSSFLLDRYGIKTVSLDDSMVAMRILYPDFPYGLDFVTTEFTREPYYKEDGKKHMKYGTSEDKFWLYCGKDSCCSLEAFLRMMPLIEAAGNKDTYYKQVALLEPLLYMTGRGLRMDVDGLKKATSESQEKQDIFQKALEEIVGRPINASSSKQVREYFYDEKGVAPYYKWVKKGGKKYKKVTADRTALVRIARLGFTEARIMLSIRGEVKLRGTYLTMKLDPDNRLRSALGFAKSGRLSSGLNIFGRGMDTQNLPPPLRKYIPADEGYVFYEPDYSQGELRILAVIAPEPTMIRAFEERRDVHSLTAGLLFDKPPSQISDEEGSSILGGGVYMISERAWGKKSNFELGYGMGPSAFSLMMEVPEKEGKPIWTRWHSIYPAIRGSYHEWVKAALRDGRLLTNLCGRKRFFLGRLDDDTFRDAYSYIPQSTIATMINNRALLKMYYDQEMFRELELLNQVHDSAWIQIPLSASWKRHAEMLLCLKDSMEQPISWRGYDFIIPTDIKMGNTSACDIKLGEVEDNVTWLADKLEDRWNSLVKRTNCA